MKPEAQDQVDRAHAFIRRAEAALVASRHEPLTVEDAARNAYYAAFHMARALITERGMKVPKKHGSVHNAFRDLTNSDAAFDGALRDYLSKAYEFKRKSDYEIGTKAEVTASDAQSAVADAKRFVAVVSLLLPP